MTDTAVAPSLTEDSTHPLDSLHRVLLEIVDRLPWHSEDQYLQMRHLVRTSEQGMKEDGAVPVVPPGPPNAGPPAANPNEVLTGAGVTFDYDKLAAAMLRAQQQQQAQAAAAVEADPTFEPPGSVTAPDSTNFGQGAEVAASDPNASPA